MCTRVYLDGIFDLGPHAGHIGFMETVKVHAEKETGNTITLIVGVISDVDATSYKRKPVVEEHLRAKCVRSLRIVDEVVRNSPLVLTSQFMEHHRIDLVYHGDDSKQEVFFAVPIAQQKMRYVKYDSQTTGISTSELIRRAFEYYSATH